MTMECILIAMVKSEKSSQMETPPEHRQEKFFFLVFILLFITLGIMTSDI